MIEQVEIKKIALVGTSCVGKSSIYDYFQSSHHNDPRVEFVDEASRLYFESHPEIPVIDRFGLKPQGEIQDLAIHLEKLTEMPGVEVVICDRSVLDAPAYVRGHGDLTGSRQLLDRVRDHIPSYHRVFLLDTKGVPYQKDSIRQEEPEVRERNHQAFVEMFLEEGISYTLLSGSLHDRIGQVEASLT